MGRDGRVEVEREVARRLVVKVKPCARRGAHVAPEDEPRLAVRVGVVGHRLPRQIVRIRPPRRCLISIVIEVVP